MNSGFRRHLFVSCLMLMALCFTSSLANAADWNQWAGPNRDFKIEATGLADKWPEDGPPKIWSRDLGAGYSGIVVVDDVLYTMTRDEVRDVVVALDANSGKTKWEYKYENPVEEPHVLNFGKGPNATPLVKDGRIYTVSFTGKFHCLDIADGKPLWSHDLIDEFVENQKFGYAASPLFYKGNVVVLASGKHGMKAFDAKTGKLAWAGDAIDISYASPKLINVDGQDQFVVMSNVEVIGVDPNNGKKLWSAPCRNQYDNNATDPIWGDDNILWVSTQLDGGTRALKLTQKDGKTKVDQLWFNEKVKIFHWNAIRLGDCVYGSIGSQTTRFSAIDIKTGDVKWRENGFHKALCVYADKKIYFLDENGVLAMARVRPEKCEILGQVQLTEKASWTAPTIVDGKLFVRDTKKIMALDISK